MKTETTLIETLIRLSIITLMMSVSKRSTSSITSINVGTKLLTDRTLTTTNTNTTCEEISWTKRHQDAENSEEVTSSEELLLFGIFMLRRYVRRPSNRALHQILKARKEQCPYNRGISFQLPVSTCNWVPKSVE